MTDAMNRIHMGLWAISSAPLMVGSDLTRLSPTALSLLKNREALAIHNDPYGLQPIKVMEPSPGVQVWAKPMAVAGRRAVAVLNGTDNPAQLKIAWSKLGFDSAPRSVRDVWNSRDLATADEPLSVPVHDLMLLVVDGQDTKPAEYVGTKSEITGIKATSGPTFARLECANTSGHVAVVRVKSTSGFYTSLALPSTAGSDRVTVGLILPHGTADLPFEAQPAVISKLAVYSW
jgi:Alpha galactosidase C-terminal beta sandwich domain/Alpha galactosidase A